MNVTSDVTADTGDDEIQLSSQAPLSKRKSRLYMTRSGTSFVFQMRLPTRFCGGRSRVMRLSLGPCSYARARFIVDVLAAEARIFIARRLQHVNDHRNLSDAINPTDLLQFGTAEENLVALTTYMHMMHLRLKAVQPEQIGNGLDSHSGIRGLVGIAREIRNKEEGRAYNEIIVENSSALREKYVATLTGKRVEAGTAIETDKAGDTPLAPWVIAAIDAGELKRAKRHPAFDLDRRLVPRFQSKKPRFSELAEEYFSTRERNPTGNSSQVTTERSRAKWFVELIGDHPVDTYSPTDLQAFVNALKYCPKAKKPHQGAISAEAILVANVRLSEKPISKKTILDGYVSIVKAIMSSGAKAYQYKSPLFGESVDIPNTAPPSEPSQPLSYEKISEIFRVGVEIGYIDTVVMPLLGHLSGRRLGLLCYLQGSDIREKFPGVFVASVPALIQENGVWKRSPHKTDASVQYFILHDFLKEIGFVEWACSKGSQFLFPTLTELADPAKSASSYMQRLFSKAGVEKGRREVFHSLRGGLIDDLRDHDIDARTTRMQAGHDVGHDIHELYGSSTISERKARKLATMPLNPEVDYSVFRGLDFESIFQRRRTVKLD